MQVSKQPEDGTVLGSNSEPNQQIAGTLVCNLSETESDELATNAVMKLLYGSPKVSENSKLPEVKSPACLPVTALVWAEAASSDLTSPSSKQEYSAPLCWHLPSLVVGEFGLSSESKFETSTEMRSLECSGAGHSESSVVSSTVHAERIDSALADVLEANFGDADLHSMVSEEAKASPNLDMLETLHIELSGAGRGNIRCSLYEYEGEIRANRPHGWGLQKFKTTTGEFSGLTYRGNFVDGLANCVRGVAVWSHGLEFKGEFVRGCPKSGILTESDGEEHPAVFSKDEYGPKLWEITERHIVAATKRGENIGNLGEGQAQVLQIKHKIDLNGKSCAMINSDSEYRSPARGPSEDCSSEHHQQLAFLLNLFPDCDEPVVTDILRVCEDDIGKAIEFLLPASVEAPRPVDDKRRIRRFKPINLTQNSEVTRTGKQRSATVWSAQGGLAQQLKVATRHELLVREFPSLSASDVEEALSACRGNVDEARQQLLVMDMSKQDSENTGGLRDKVLAQHMYQDAKSSERSLRLVSIPTSEQNKQSSLVTKDLSLSECDASTVAASEKEEWKLSKSKRARGERIGTGSYYAQKQYEGMGGNELRRLAFQHSKMYSDLSRIAVSAFQAGDRIEAARLSEKARQHQEQFQILNEMARARIIDTFNADKDGELCVDLHQLLVVEALELLEAKMRQWSALAGGRRLLVDVVTGAGNHSREGRAVLRPRVKAWLEERGMRYYPINDGMLKVDASTFPR